MNFYVIVMSILVYFHCISCVYYLKEVEDWASNEAIVHENIIKLHSMNFIQTFPSSSEDREVVLCSLICVGLLVET